MSFRSDGETTLEVVRKCDPSPFCESFPKFSLAWDYFKAWKAVSLIAVSSNTATGNTS
jgi:hypothetical protein